MLCPNYDSVIASKKLSSEKLQKALNALKRYKADENVKSFAGNPVLYHFMLDNLCRVKNKRGSFYEMMESEELREDMWKKAIKYSNGFRENNPPMLLFETWRRMNGAIVFFKPTTAMYIYKKYNATAVLDPTAGWGGRMLGAWALDISYTGIDTNKSLRPAYSEMMKLLASHPLDMIWEDALTVDFSEIDYDCVLTSPPYINLELYPGMTPFESKAAFYKNFLIPLIDKCRKNIKREGRVCFNISPAMYSDLTDVFKYEKAKETVPLLQHMGKNADKSDKIYVW